MHSPTFVIRKGLDISLRGEPAQAIESGPSIGRVAVLAADYPEIRPRLHVKAGDRVRAGQALFSDRHHRALKFTSPAPGVVSEVATDDRHRLRSVVIAVEGDDATRFRILDAQGLAAARPEEIEEQLLASGLWTTLRTRPFGRIPAPGTRPANAFVTAIDTHPLAPSPATVIAERAEAFKLGLAALARLTAGRVFLCQGPGDALPHLELPEIVVARFDGPHPAGLPGTHMHLLAPATVDRTAWHVGYQDVAAIGELFSSGRLDPARVVALAGPAVRRPRLIRTCCGASLSEMVRGELFDEAHARSHVVVSGSLLAGRAANGVDDFLGARHVQVTALAMNGDDDWILAHRGRPGPFVPVPAYERVLPMDILPVPLLRALLTEDDETAVELGALEFDEDDLALLSFVCPARNDYGALLRAALSRVQADR